MTATQPTVGLALIARDEERTLPRLLASIEGAFDRVALLDTGSTDRTIQVFQDWAGKQTGLTFSVGRYEWRDDFADARNTADRLLLYGSTDLDPQAAGAVRPLVDWVCWADCDDAIEGAEHIRTIAAHAPPHVTAFLAGYDYVRDEHGNVVCRLKRERIVRANAGRWVGRVHEAQHITGALGEIDEDLVRWVHHKDFEHSPPSSDRNLRILRAWNDDEPDDPRVVGYLGTELAGRGELEEAIGFFRQYLGLKTGWDEERCQIHRKLSACLLALDRPDEALDVALQALRVMPDWPDTYLSLAQATYKLGEPGKAAHWAREVLRRGAPETMLIINPLDYTLQPRVVLAAALGALGELEEAIQVAEEALQIVPDHRVLLDARAEWAVALKRQSTARTFVGVARQLVADDEQLKALTLLNECVPVYATDHPEVVALRSSLRERLHWATSDDAYQEFYADGGAKPEDVIPDEKVAEVCEHLPRARFLAASLEEMRSEREAA